VSGAVEMSIVLGDDVFFSMEIPQLHTQGPLSFIARKNKPRLHNHFKHTKKQPQPSKIPKMDFYHIPFLSCFSFCYFANEEINNNKSCLFGAAAADFFFFSCVTFKMIKLCARRISFIKIFLATKRFAVKRRNSLSLFRHFSCKTELLAL
jgi:hypothetical protein